MKNFLLNNKINFLFLFISFLCLIAIVGKDNLSFTSINWLHDSDESSYNQLGWYFFKNDIWRFPLGSNPNFGDGIGNSIVYTDSVPFLALIFKSIKLFIPNNFQYFSFWYFICFYFQLFFSYSILKSFTNSVLYSFIGSLFFLISPIFVDRVDYHVGLSGQWLLLFALYLGLTQRVKDNKISWVFLVSLSSLVHFYFSAMILVIYFFLRVFNFYFEKERFFNLLKDFLIITLFLFLTLYLSGYFEIRMADSLGIGFGDYKLNLLSIFDPGIAYKNISWSWFLPDIKLSTGEEIEGFNYLGLGQIMMILLSLVLFLNKKYKTNIFSIKKNRNINIFIFISLFFTLWALSNKISFGSYTILEIPIHKYIFGIMSIIKSTGRLFWIVNYFLLALSIIIIFKCFKEKNSLIIIISLFLLQVADVSAGLKDRIGLHNKVKNEGVFLKDHIWDNLFKENKILNTTYPISWSGLFGSFSYAMEKNNIQKTNLITVARINRAAVAKVRYFLYDNFRKKNLATNTIYAIDGLGHLRHLKHIYKDENVGFLYRDGIWIMVPKEKEMMTSKDIKAFEEIKPKLLKINQKKKLYFKDQDNYYGLGWSHNSNKPGIWSEGKISTLLLRTENNLEDLKLEIFTEPYLTKKNKVLEFDIYVNDIFNKKAQLKNNKKIEIIIKKEIIKNDLLKIDFNFKNPVSPYEVLESPDSRQLGMLVTDINILQM